MADRWLYQARAEPPAANVLAAAPVTLDQWFQPLAVPVRPRPQTREGASVIVFSAILSEAPVTLDRWFQPIGVPVLPRRQTQEGFVEPHPPWSAIAPANPAEVSLDWDAPQSLPQFGKRWTPDAYPDAPIEPILPIPEPDLSTWYQPASEPARALRQTQPGWFVVPLEPSVFSDRVPDLSTWFRIHPDPLPRRMPAREGFFLEPPGGALFADSHPRPETVLHHFSYRLTMRVRDTMSLPNSPVAVIDLALPVQRFGPTTTPIMDRCSYSEQTIGGGGTTNIDFSALPGTQRTVDARGKSLRYLFVRNRGTHSLSVGPAASTPLEPFGAGNTPQFPAGAIVSLFLPDGVQVNDSAYLLKLTGTATEESEVALIVG